MKDRLIRVLQVTSDPEEEDPPGQSVYLQKGLSAKGYETRLISTPTPRPSESTHHSQDFRNTIRRASRFLRDIRRSVREFRPHILHSHGHIAGTLSKLALARNRGVATIHSIPNNARAFSENGITSSFCVGLERRLRRTTDRVAVTTQWAWMRVVSAGIAEKDRCVVTHPGLDIRKFRNAKRNKGGIRTLLDLDQNAFVAGLFFSEEERSLSRDCMNAIRVCRRESQQVRFILFGRALDETQTRQLLRDSDLSETCSVLSNGADPMDIYADIDILISISPGDRFPVKSIEALAAGVPASAPDSGPIEEILNSPFWLTDTYPTGHLEEWIGTLLDVNANREYYSRLAEECKQYVIERHGLESFVANHDKLYRQVLSEKESPEKSS